MGKQKSNNRRNAFEYWKRHNGQISNKEIAENLGVHASQVSKWKKEDKWESRFVLSALQPSNKNPDTNGLFTKFLPIETLEVAEALIDKGPADMMYDNIILQYSAIIRAQKIMLVKDQGDLTKEVKREKSIKSKGTTQNEIEYELQYAWDKQGNFLKAQSTAMKTLLNLIKQYESMANEEQKLKVEKIKQSIITEKDKLNINKAKMLLEVDKVRGDNKANSHAEALRKKMQERKNGVS